MVGGGGGFKYRVRVLVTVWFEHRRVEGENDDTAIGKKSLFGNGVRIGIPACRLQFGRNQRPARVRLGGHLDSRAW